MYSGTPCTLSLNHPPSLLVRNMVPTGLTIVLNLYYIEYVRIYRPLNLVKLFDNNDNVLKPTYTLPGNIEKMYRQGQSIIFEREQTIICEKQYLPHVN